MSYETLINEPVNVWVFFDSGKETKSSRVSPVAMNWQRRFVKFEKLILVTSKRVGQVKILSFVCASETSNFELEYNSESQAWKVVRIMPKDG